MINFTSKSVVLIFFLVKTQLSEYLAPEILENKGHGKAVDWWSLVLIFTDTDAGPDPDADAC